LECGFGGWGEGVLVRVLLWCVKHFRRGGGIEEGREWGESRKSTNGKGQQQTERASGNEKKKK